MLAANERRRVLIAATPEASSKMRELFEQPHLEAWDFLEAENFGRARFVLQYHPCDALLVHGDLYDREGGQGLAWLAWNREIPVVLLSGPNPETFTRAYELGVNICLPSDLAIEHPSMIASALGQAMQIHNVRRDFQRAKDQVQQGRRHIDRLVSILWRSSPRQAEAQWFPQRYLMDRLQEELSRTERHGLPLSLALGEIQPADQEATAPEPVPDWAADAILRGKRRCDVAGQYGPHGFLLMMVHTKKDGAVTCCRRLQKHLEHTANPVQPNHPSLQAYFGLASVAPNRMSPQALLRCAEENLEMAHQERQERLVAG